MKVLGLYRRKNGCGTTIEYKERSTFRNPYSIGV